MDTEFRLATNIKLLHPNDSEVSLKCLVQESPSPKKAIKEERPAANHDTSSGNILPQSQVSDSEDDFIPPTQFPVNQTSRRSYQREYKKFIMARSFSGGYIQTREDKPADTSY
eukprot:TRINITY_DN39975_c0_g1_i1.p2 TRINITY_DN39975_c0_g1~~TRINITY_DN39975_c0_g1_i1.p2  ORF type:complete len:113 (-),score=23.09 TRINITY_DN39975_c0_g1_i1:230-568(-)